MSSTPDKSIFNRHLKFWQIVLILTPCLLLIGFLSVRFLQPSRVPWFDRIGRDYGNAALAGGVGMTLLFFHAFFLWILRERTTDKARRIINFTFRVALVVAMALLIWSVFSQARYAESISLALLAIVVVWILARGIIAVSLPSSPLGLIPLVLNYAIVFGLYILAVTGVANARGSTAGLLLGMLGFFSPILLVPVYLFASYGFPMHRRIAKEWRPKRLPRLPKFTGSAGLESSRTPAPMASSGSSADPV